MHDVYSVRLATPKEIKTHDRAVDSLRFDRLVQHLRELFGRHAALVVAWEDVQFASTLYQVQLWTTLRAAVWAALHSCGAGPAPFDAQRLAVPVGTLKKFATGSGAADKDRMLAAAVAAGHVPAGTGLDDNAIDALWVALWAQKLYGNAR